MPDPDPLYQKTIADFRNARRRAALEEVMARLRGKSADLLPFEEVRKLLKGGQSIKRGLREIPLDAIIGSVGRYGDFTRSFLPRYDSDVDRWTRLDAIIDQRGMDPIEVYQIGQAYFVLDGNHRVSIARSRGYQTIQAYVTEIRTKVPLSPDDQPDDVILKAELADFLECTRLDKTRPHADLRVTAPGHYRFLLRQIAAVQHSSDHELSCEQAALIWFEQQYIPVIRVIRERGLLRDFPGRTETDLYVWLSKRREELEKALGWNVSLEKTAQNLREAESPKPARVAARIGGKLYDALTPDPFEAGPRPGQWRRDMLDTHRESRLFVDVLVPISGEEHGWKALEQAIVFALPEKDHLHGLHVVARPEEVDSPRARAIKERFEQRCREAGLPGELIVESGKIARKICERACWADIVILNLNHPPGPAPAARLASGFRTLIHRCCRPILAVPQVSPQLDRLLLAYDGSPKAREALFIAAYLTGKWQHQLDVLIVAENQTSQKATRALLSAKEYLQSRRVQANFLTRRGKVADTILSTAAERATDLIIMGGYGFSPVLEMVLGSAVDQVLRETRIPVLFCR